MTTDPRIDRLEGQVQEMSLCITSVENRLTSLEATMNARFDALQGRLTTMFASLVGTMMVGFVVLGVAIILTR